MERKRVRRTRRASFLIGEPKKTVRQSGPCIQHVNRPVFPGRNNFCEKLEIRRAYAAT
jgi:hypothetical protein